MLDKIIRPWPVKVTIFEKRRNTYVPIEDKARMTIEKGKRYYELKKKGVKIKPVKLDDLYYVGGENKLYLINPRRDVFLPMRIDDKTCDIKIVDEDVRFWNLLQEQEALTKYQEKSFVEKYMPIIMVFVLAIALSIILFVVLEQLGTINEGLKDVADALKAAVSEVKTAPIPEEGRPPF
jgi:hypothetical protein